MKVILQTAGLTCLSLGDDADLYLEFFVGGSGAYGIRMKLNDLELERLRYEGEKYLDRLADDVSGAPEKYAGRLVHY